jgi:peptidoglycan/xylan/chitin deacetylase (PgdA/CDA1 family)
VAITFDDGTADFVDNAVPILVRHRIPVTLYLTTAPVDEGRSFWDDGTVLSWSALADACSTGLVDVGSHTHRHLLLDREDPDVVADDLDRSSDLIGEHVGVAPRHFAYPKALAPSDAADALVRARFSSAALAGGRTNGYGRTDPHRLARTPLTVRDRTDDVLHKANGGRRLEGAIRERIDRRRYRGRAS